MKHAARRLTLALAVLLAVVLVLVLLGADRSEAHPLQQLTISEICAANESLLSDSRGKYPDYLELHNPTREGVSLAGLTVSDGVHTSQPLPDIYLAPGGYRVIFLSETLTGFGLSAAGGEELSLLSAEGQLLSRFKTVPTQADQVMSLQGGRYLVTEEATPGYSNDRAGRTAFLTGKPGNSEQLVITEVLYRGSFILPDAYGDYPAAVEVYNASQSPIYLGDFFFGNRASGRLQCRLPDVWLQPGAYTYVLCDQLELKSGETLYLTDSQGVYTALDLPAVQKGQSLVLAGADYAPGGISLGHPNTADGVAAFAASRMDADAPLVITEVLLSGAGVPVEGALTDAVEIYNRSSQPVNTAGWYLQDSTAPEGFPLPELILQPGEYAVILCSRQTTGFALSEGEEAVLVTPEGYFATRISCGEAPGCSSSFDLEAAYWSFSAPSLGYANTEAGRTAFQQPAGGALRLSEVVSGGEEQDWVEVYNASNAPISLGDYCLTLDPKQPSRYPLPHVTLQPGDYCVIYMDPQAEISGRPAVAMTLSAQGEQLYLTRSGVLVDYYHLPELILGRAYGRSADGQPGVLKNPTPGAANAALASFCLSPVAVTPQGVYNNVEYVDVVLEGSGRIYYTLDGTTPGADALRYTGPIRLTETAVLRVVCRETGKTQSDSLDLTYVINEADTLDVITLVTDPANLFDYETGIYVGGPGGNVGDYPYYEANYFQPWERFATVSFFPLEGESFSEPCGIRIHGAFSRAQDKKSLAVMFRGSYGCSSLEYPLFGEDGLDSYESFLLRACGQDAGLARMRDEVVTSLVGEYTDVAVQDYRPVAVYINGTYWGLHYIREKISEHYVAGHYNVDADEVIMAEMNGVGVPEYKQVVSFAKQNDLRVDANYEKLCQMMDVTAYADYIIAQICVGNTDNANVKFFRPGNGKWTWILYDTDLALRSPGVNTVYTHLNPEGTAFENFLDTDLINALLEREEFRDWFLARIAWQIQTMWSEEPLTARIDALEAQLREAIEKDCLRWGDSFERWQTHMQSLREFAAEREGNLIRFVQSYFGLTDPEMASYGFRMQ